MNVIREIRIWLFWNFGIGSLPKPPSIHSIGWYYFSKEHPFPNTLKQTSITSQNKMNYCVIKGRNQYIALAKKEPFTRENPDPINEPGELYFEFGNTPEQAMSKLKESLEDI